MKRKERNKTHKKGSIIFM